MRLRILDRYILGKFLTTFVFTVFTLTLVICVIDYVEKNDDFIRTQPGIGKILGVYYLNFFPYYANMLSPITVFIATVFVTSRLAARTEIVAMLSGGVSFIRLLMPFAAGAVIVGTGIFFLTNFVIPRANQNRVAFEVQYLKNPFVFSGRNVHIKTAPNTFAYLESYSNTASTGYNFTLETIINRKLVSKLRAERVIWQIKKDQWQCENYSIRTLDTAGRENVKQGLALDTAFGITPEDFSNSYLLYETLTTPELNKFINVLQNRGADNLLPYLIEKYLRLTYPFAILILTLIGVILSARKSREGPGFQIALGFLLAFVYIIFFIMSRSIAQAGSMPPLLACWLPNIVFACIGLVLFKTVPK